MAATSTTITQAIPAPALVPHTTGTPADRTLWPGRHPACTRRSYHPCRDTHFPPHAQQHNALHALPPGNPCLRPSTSPALWRQRCARQRRLTRRSTTLGSNPLGPRPLPLRPARCPGIPHPTLSSRCLCTLPPSDGQGRAIVVQLNLTRMLFFHLLLTA